MQEIERKFLVENTTFKEEAFKKYSISQGYLNSHKERAVRVRLKDNIGFLTVKGKSSESGASRFEWEKQISLPEAKELLKLCEPGKIQKTRYLVKFEDHTFEVDEFFGENEGLLIAEIELNAEQEYFEKPAWLGKEVTGESCYYNAQLSKVPFKNW